MATTVVKMPRALSYPSSRVTLTALPLKPLSGTVKFPLPANTDVPARLMLGANALATTEAVAVYPEPQAKTRMRAAIRRLTAEAHRLLGPRANVSLARRHDDDRSPSEYFAIQVNADVRTVSELLAGEEQLIDMLISEFPDVEENFVIVCSRRHPR